MNSSSLRRDSRTYCESPTMIVPHLQKARHRWLTRNARGKASSALGKKSQSISRRNRAVGANFLDKTLCRGEAHTGQSSGYDRNLIGQFPANVPLSLAVCPGFSLDEKVGGGSRLDCSAHNRVRLGCCRNHPTDERQPACQV